MEPLKRYGRVPKAVNTSHARETETNPSLLDTFSRTVFLEA
jgi:hypothetical protein